MNIVTPLTALRTPVRASVSDSPLEILKFAVSAFESGGVALATLVEIRGGAARPLGSHLAIAADGRYCGYVSGGCVEAAVATEALVAMMEGCDRLVKFGNGSPFFDIVLPCGGGISVSIHLLREVESLQQVINSLHARQGAALTYNPEVQTLVAVNAIDRAGWEDGKFRTVYRPPTRLIVSGQSAETAALLKLADVSGYDTLSVQSDSSSNIGSRIDQFTAVALLHHDLDAEIGTLKEALASNAFYVGALGSTRTHRRRVNRLNELGLSHASTDRIKAPIGMFGPTRDSNSLAISVLADIAAARLAVYP